MIRDLPQTFSGATLSPCRKYRYALWRRWEPQAPYALFVGLNPSTADEYTDDPTIRRCKRFASDWGYGGLCVANLFALRATNPADMIAHSDPVGPDNNAWLEHLANNASAVILAWGAKGSHRGRNRECENILARHYPKCLGKTKAGHPRHPLYIRADATPADYFG